MKWLWMRRKLPWIGIGVAPVISILVGCACCTWNLDQVDYTPLLLDDWAVSTPEEQGLDPILVAKLYYDAAKLETLYGLLVIKNGYLVAEGYFNKGSVNQLSARQSVTKSYTSAIIGIALDQGYLTSLDQKMVEFFPELADQITDPMKLQITIRSLLQMRGGYPDEEKVSPYLEIMYFSDNWHWVPHLVDFPLINDPGTEFNYSNLTSHLLAVIAARACETDLKSFAEEHLFSQINATVVEWSTDADGYYMGSNELYVRARDMAKFGLLYLRNGEHDGKQVLPAAWVADSLKRYSENIFVGAYLTSRYGTFYDLGYGYQWWSASIGDHQFNFALGHGGNYVILLSDLDIIIVTTADPLYDPELAAGGGWIYEGAINSAVGNFIRSLPAAK